jgi:hypothetical protein
MEDIKKEIEYMLKRDNDILEITDNNKDEKIREQHLIALGKIMALNDLKYSVDNDDYLYKKEIR